MKDFDLSKFRHKTELNVRFMDVDALQHVNNARYLNFLEESRLAYSEEVLGMYKDLSEMNVVVARIEIDFLRPITFKEKVVIYTRVAKIGNSSFTFESIICAQLNDKIIPSARSVQIVVAFDLKTQKSIPLPDDIKKKVEAYEGSN